MTQRTAAKEIKVRGQDKKFFFLSWRKFYVSLVGTPRSHTTNSECLCFNSPCIIYESEHWKWSTSSFHFWRPRRQRSRCSRSSFEPITQGTTATRANCNLLQRHTWGPYRKFCWNLTGVSSWIVCHIVIRQKQLRYWESFCAETLACCTSVRIVSKNISLLGVSRLNEANSNR